MSTMSGPLAQFLDAMMDGMYILALPAFLVVSGIAILAYRKRNRTNER
jgi:hypothetical protein